MRRHLLPLVVSMISLPALAAPGLGQWMEHRVELSPFGGYRWGGEIDASDTALFDRDVDVDEGPVAGLRAEFALTPNFAVEVLASRQTTEFTTGGDELFGDERRLSDVNIDTLQGGILFQGGSGQIRPFGVLTLGLTRLDPEGASSDERFSSSFGGGVKIFMNRNFGFRFEGRGYWTDTDEEDWDDDCCDDDWNGGDDLFQGEATAGLIFAF